VGRRDTSDGKLVATNPELFLASICSPEEREDEEETEVKDEEPFGSWNVTSQVFMNHRRIAPLLALRSK
jgi:hypothetical protein